MRNLSPLLACGRTLPGTVSRAPEYAITREATDHYHRIHSFVKTCARALRRPTSSTLSGSPSEAHYAGVKNLFMPAVPAALYLLELVLQVRYEESSRQRSWRSINSDLPVC